MNIAGARKIDYWIGLPLCFFLSILNHISSALTIVKKENSPAKRIAIIKLSELGAIVLAYPFLNSLKNNYPSSELFFVTFDRNKSIFRFLNDLIPKENVYGIRESPVYFVPDILRAILKLRKEKIDTIFDLEFFSRLSAIFSFLTGAKKRIGFYGYAFEGLYRGNLLTHKLQYNPLNHIARNYLSLSQLVKLDKKDTPQIEEYVNCDGLDFPQYALEANKRDKLTLKLKDLGVEPGRNKLFLINPGEGVLALREWPIDNFIRLIRLILKDNNNRIILIGVEGASRKAKIILEAIDNPNCVSLANQTELEELLGIFSLADILISNDCGLAHLAMLSRIKKIVIFGPESPQVFSPLGKNSRIVYSNWPCSPCLSVLNHRNSDCRDNLCLKAITPESVFNLIPAS
jgi:ADP-heptose:LPS heptosyltransferase